MSGGIRGLRVVLVGLLVATSFGTTAAEAAVLQVGTCKIEPHTQCPGADLHGADLTGANLWGANLSGANLSGANLHRANLYLTDLRSANLVGANLSYAGLEHVHMHGANLSGSNMQAVRGSRADISRAGLTGANLAGASLEDANLDGSQLGLAHLAQLNATHASMQSTNFAGSNLNDAWFDHADLRHANFHSATLHHTQFAGADIRDAQFFHASFHQTNMHQANAVGAKFWPSNLEADSGALHAVFEKVSAHLDAYDQFGGCDGGSTFESKERLPAKGGCRATGQPGGSHGFDNTAKSETGFYWEGGNRNLMTVWGRHEVSLAGYCSHNWASFAVTTVHGLHAYPTQGIERPPGSPGGPLALAIHYRQWWLGIKSFEGYIMFMNGWLLRQHHPTITPGPRPR